MLTKLGQNIKRTIGNSVLFKKSDNSELENSTQQNVMTFKKQRNQFQTPRDIERPDIPIFITTVKVYNNDFEKERNRRINTVFEAVRDYYDYMLGFDCIASKPDICQFLENLIKDFIIVFWDMPSSEHHHDNDDYGHLIHSLQVACLEAEQCSTANVFYSAGIDTERSHKERPYLILSRFIVGLLHDSNKIFQYNLREELGSQVNHYIPLRGSILNFMLISRTTNVRKGWMPNKYPDLSIVHYFYKFIPLEIQEVFPPQIYFDMLKALSSYTEVRENDMKAIQKWAKDGEKTKEISRIIYEYLNLKRDSLGNNLTSDVFRLCENWYAVKAYNIFNHLSVQTNLSNDSIALIMFEAELIGGYKNSLGELVYYDEFLIYTDSRNSKSQCPQIFAFFKAPYLEEIIDTIYRTLRNIDDRETTAELPRDQKPGIAFSRILIHEGYKPLVDKFVGKLKVQNEVFGIVGDYSKAKDEAQSEKVKAEAEAPIEVVDDNSPVFEDEDNYEPTEADFEQIEAVDDRDYSEEQEEEEESPEPEPEIDPEPELKVVLPPILPVSEVVTPTESKPDKQNVLSVPATEEEIESEAAYQSESFVSKKELAKSNIIITNSLNPIIGGLGKKVEEIKIKNLTKNTDEEIPFYTKENGFSLDFSEQMLFLFVEHFCKEGGLHIQQLSPSCMLFLDIKRNLFVKLRPLLRFLIERAKEKNIIDKDFTLTTLGATSTCRNWETMKCLERIGSNRDFYRSVSIRFNLLSLSSATYLEQILNEEFAMLLPNSIEPYVRGKRLGFIKKINKIHRLAYPPNKEVL